MYRDEAGVLVHGELLWPGGGGLMLGAERDNPHWPARAGARGDVPRHRRRRRRLRAGHRRGRRRRPASREDGDQGRSAAVADPEGNLWAFGTYVPTGPCRRRRPRTRPPRRRPPRRRTEPRAGASLALAAGPGAGRDRAARSRRGSASGAGSDPARGGRRATTCSSGSPRWCIDVMDVQRPRGRRLHLGDLHRHLRPGLGVPGVRRPPARLRRRPADLRARAGDRGLDAAGGADDGARRDRPAARRHHPRLPARRGRPAPRPDPGPRGPRRASRRAEP